MFKSSFFSSLFIQYYFDKLSFALVYLLIFEVKQYCCFRHFYGRIKLSIIFWCIIGNIESEIISTD